LILFLVNVAIRRWVVRRIADIGHAIDDFGRQGPLPTLPESPPDEIGRLSSAFNEMTRRINRRDQENTVLSAALERRVAERGQLLKKVINAQEDERIRLARELHDELGQALSSTAIQIALAKRKLSEDPDLATSHLGQAEDILNESTAQIYALISGLRPAMLDDLGLQAALRALVKRMLDPRKIDYSLDLKCPQGELQPEIETLLYRIFQEALTNVVKHSRASSITLKLHCANESIEGELVDDGHGFDLDTRQVVDHGQGLGLLGMRERVEQFGGTIDISSRPQAGTRIHISLPREGS
jgi:signal transduction histidine kinase